MLCVFVYVDLVVITDAKDARVVVDTVSEVPAILTSYTNTILVR